MNMNNTQQNTQNMNTQQQNTKQNNAFVWINKEYGSEKTNQKGEKYTDTLFGKAIVYYNGLCLRDIQIRVSKSGETYLVFPYRTVYENGAPKLDANGYPVREDYVFPTSKATRLEISNLVDAAIEKQMAAGAGQQQ